MNKNQNFMKKPIKETLTDWGREKPTAMWREEEERMRKKEGSKAQQHKWEQKWGLLGGDGNV